MLIRITKTLFISLILFSCIDRKENEPIHLSSLIKSGSDINIDTNIVISREKLLESFDTIPNLYGELIIKKIINSLNDTSTLKKVIAYGYNRGTDTVEYVLIKRKNLRLDPKNLLSKDSYFIIIILGIGDGNSIAATIFMDEKNDKIGMFSFPYVGKVTESLDYIEKISKLSNKLMFEVR